MIVLGMDSDAGIREFALPNGGRAVEISTVPLEWNVLPVDGMTCDIVLSVNDKPIIRKALTGEEANGVTHATLFRITDALGYEWAYLGAFGRRKD